MKAWSFGNHRRGDLLFIEHVTKLGKKIKDTTSKWWV